MLIDGATADTNMIIGDLVPSVPAMPNALVLRDSTGCTYHRYISSSTENSEIIPVAQVIVTCGDDLYRKVSISHLTASLAGNASINISGTAAGVTDITGAVARSYFWAGAQTFTDVHVSGELSGPMVARLIEEVAKLTEQNTALIARLEALEAK